MMKAALANEPNAVWGESDDLEVLTFDLNGETFALEAMDVQEIIDLVPETHVPGSQSFVSSVINFRGKVIPLVDIRLAFGMACEPPTIDSRIVVMAPEIAGEPILVGLRTDKVHEVTSLSRQASEATPSVGMRWRADYIKCLVRREGDFIILPNLEAIFGRKDETPGPDRGSV